MRHYVTWTTDVDVEVDLAEFCQDLTDEELAAVGLMRVPAGVQPPTAVESYEAQPSIVEHKMLCSWAWANKEVAS